MRTSKNRKIFSANNEQGTRIFTLGLHYSCIPSYNNIVKIFSNRPAVACLTSRDSLLRARQGQQRGASCSWTNKKKSSLAGLIKKSSLAGLIKKVQLSWTNQKVQLQLD